MEIALHKLFTFPTLLAVTIATLPGAARATSTTCSTSVVCAEYINSYAGSSGGVAIHGEANGGVGVRGTSVANVGFYGASGSGLFLMPGVEGESTNNSGEDAAGAFGLNDRAEYGVLGYGILEGAYGATVAAGTSASTAGYGVEGQDATSGTFNVGVLGKSANGIGVEAEANGVPTETVGMGEPIGLYAVAKQRTKTGISVGVEAESSNLPLIAYNTTDPSHVFVGYTGYFIDANSPSGTFAVTSAGNAILSGTLTTNSSVFARTTGVSGTKRVAYGTRSASPEIEDAGQAVLTNGRALVTIDAAFGDSVDMRRAYLVFLTPEGDCKGLYVAQKSSRAFVVRELQGGRSTLTFDYRIVAKPADENGERLALDRAWHGPVAAERSMPVNISGSLTPEQRLVQRVGMRDYEKALAELRNRLLGK